MKIQTTQCCALSLIHGVNNQTSLTLLKDRIEQYKQLREINAIGLPKGIGATCFQCVTSPGEDILESNLIKLGFKHIHTFKRRTGYAEGMNKLYVLNI